MAKQKINYDKLQKAYNKRLNNQRRNDGNWTCKIVLNKTPKDIIDFNDFYYESVRAKTHSKNLKKC